MNDLIERYVYDVTRRLPENTREEVGKELRANIADMLPENATEEDVMNVLVTLGEPRELAAGYQPKPRYLISPKWMDDYLRVLKITLVVFGAIALVFGLIDALLNPEATTVLGIVAEVFAKTISGIIQSLFRAFAIVTVVFALIDNYGAKCRKEPWNATCLPQLPKENVRKISRAESIAGIIVSTIMGTVFAWFLYHNQLYIGWYEDDGLWTLVTPLFTDSVIRVFFPLFVASVVVTVADHVIKLAVGHWNVTTAVSHTVEHLFSIILFITFAKTENLLNANFLLKASDYFDVPALEIAENVANAATGFAVLIGIFVAIDLIATWVKVFKSAAKPDKK